MYVVVYKVYILRSKVDLYIYELFEDTMKERDKGK